MRAKLVSIVAAAVVALAVGGGVAGAYTMNVEPAGAFEARSIGKVTFEAGGINVECNMTFSGEMNQTAELSGGESLGAITEVEWANCEGGTIAEVLSLDWNITIRGGVLGTLPNSVFGILLGISKAIRFSVFGGIVSCLYSGSTGWLWGFSGSNPFSGGSLRWLGLTIPGGGGFCPSEMTIRGSATTEPEEEITIV